MAWYVQVLLHYGEDSGSIMDNDGQMFDHPPMLLDHLDRAVRCKK